MVLHCKPEEPRPPEALQSDNVIMTIHSEADAEALVRDLAAEWEAHSSFFMAAFDKKTGEFVAQIYVGPVNRDLPEFQIGYFADVDHEGHGYVSEAVSAAIQFIFDHLKAHRAQSGMRRYQRKKLPGSRAMRNGQRGAYPREQEKSGWVIQVERCSFGLLKSEFRGAQT